MADAQQEIEKLQAQIHKGAEETKTYLETVRRFARLAPAQRETRTNQRRTTLAA